MSTAINWSSFPEFGRKRELTYVLEVLNSRKPSGMHIVEIGTSYRYDIAELGNAILAFATLAHQREGTVNSFDGWQGSIDSADEILRTYAPAARSSVTFYCRNGEEAGEVLTTPIDLLYVDGPMEDNHNVLGIENKKCSMFARLYEKARHLLLPGALVLFDDTGPDFAGKGETAIPLMIAEGWKVLPLNSPSMVLLERP